MDMMVFQSLSLPAENNNAARMNESAMTRGHT